jgi:hypothetical protein
MKPSFLTFFYLFVAVFITSNFSFSQATIWSDNFNNGCASGCLASTWNGWTIVNNVGGVSGGSPNNWFISCAEEGITPPGCGSSCIGDASLHIGADAGGGGDMGASFNETGATNATFKRVTSPVISTAGYSTITLAFDFIAYGSAACSDDRLQLQLSSDGGATWPVGYQYCLTSVCCGACNGYSQGQWTTYTIALPPAFNNNPNVRVGYHWRNNGNGSGTDPSAAIDDIRLTAPIPLSVDLINFSAEKNGTVSTSVVWEVMNELNFSHYELERSVDGLNFSKIYSIDANCVSENTCDYLYKDISHVKTIYYRLKMIDIDGEFNYSQIISLDENGSNSINYTLVSSFVNDNLLNVIINSKKKTNASFILYNTAGNIVLTENNIGITTGYNENRINISKLSSGVYILKIHLENDSKILSAKVIKK